MKTMTLFRPVGAKELELIRESGFRAFPPRLPHQPIFYPVLNEAYAHQIACDWNTKDATSGNAGFVTRFEVLSDYLRHFTVHTVGNATHQEYWIPAEEMAQFNQAIVGLIAVIAEYHGERDDLPSSPST